MIVLSANSGDPDQMPHSVVSDLGLHLFAITLLGVSRLQWVIQKKTDVECVRTLFITEITEFQPCKFLELI